MGFNSACLRISSHDLFCLHLLPWIRSIVMVFQKNYVMAINHECWLIAFIFCCILGVHTYLIFCIGLQMNDNNIKNTGWKNFAIVIFYIRTEITVLKPDFDARAFNWCPGLCPGPGTIVALPLRKWINRICPLVIHTVVLDQSLQNMR